MAIPRQIKCITKTDRLHRHEKIKNIGGDWGKLSEAYAITLIENETFDYYIAVDNYKANVIIGEYEGRKYLKTDKDTLTVDNLLDLPECP
ncbi:MAG: DUF3892 domain-containing protein [Ginsengibacter sp.]